MLIALGFVQFSCSKKDAPEPTAEELAHQADVTAANSIITVEMILNELEYIMKQAPNNPTETSFLNCATITRQQLANSFQIEASFSPTAVCSDNISRSGKLIINYPTGTGNATVKSEGYKVNTLALSGNFSFQQVTENQKPLLRLLVPDGELSVASGDYIRFNVDRKSFFKEGHTTNQLTDDVYEISSATYDLQLKNQSQITHIDAESDLPYLVTYSCNDKFRPRSGKFSFMRTNGTERLVSFGNGACSDQAVFQ